MKFGSKLLTPPMIAREMLRDVELELRRAGYTTTNADDRVRLAWAQCKIPSELFKTSLDELVAEWAEVPRKLAIGLRTCHTISPMPNRDQWGFEYQEQLNFIHCRHWERYDPASDQIELAFELTCKMNSFGMEIT